MIVIPSFCLSDKVRSAASLVVPAVTTAVLPARSRYERTREVLGTMSLVPAMKKIGENATCSRRSAFEIDLTRSDLLQAVRRGHRGKADADVHAVELAGDVLHDLAAKVDRIADRLPQAIEIGERQRALAIAERDGAGFLDPLERTGKRADVVRFLRAGRQPEHQDGCGGQDNGGGRHACAAPARAARPPGTHQATCG